MNTKTATTRAVRADSGPPLADAPLVEIITHDRAHDAHRMHLAGHDWTEIAAATGYANAKTATMAVTAYLQRTGGEQAPDQRRAALGTELDRIDEERPHAEVSQPRTLAVSGSPEGYVAQLRSIVENDPEAQARFWPD